MTRQNRVLPTGEVVALPFRGAWMGNRGILHDEEGRLGRARWRHPHWIICRLEFKGRRRPVMAPRRYTELFFLDEAVALAAGHRPCAECRRDAFNAYRRAWADAHGGPLPTAGEMDRRLHAARIDPLTRGQRRFRARLADLPDGVFVEDAGSGPALLWRGSLHPCRGPHYEAGIEADPAAEMQVLTPAPSVAALRAGYLPAVGIGA